MPGMPEAARERTLPLPREKEEEPEEKWGVSVHLGSTRELKRNSAGRKVEPCGQWPVVWPKGSWYSIESLLL